jgi:methylmalonyl-CoA mutase
MRLRATVGEVSDAMEKSSAVSAPRSRPFRGLWRGRRRHGQLGNAQGRNRQFNEEEGRRPRIMIAKLGQDGHDRGAKVVATAFADLGFDIDVGPLFQTPEEAARLAIENDVHAVGVSSLAAGHKTLLPALVQALKDQGADDIIVFAGGVIPAQDYDFLFQAGAKAIFGPGTRIEDSAMTVLAEIRKARAPTA